MDPRTSGALPRPETLRGSVERHLRESIASGRLAPGTRLVERELCESLQVSRTSLREALRRLEAERLIEVVAHRGPVVATMSLEDARDLYAIRAELEGFAAEQFARHASAEHLGALRSAIDHLKACVHRRQHAGLLEAKSRFYDALLAGAASPLATEILQGLLTRINLLRSTSLARPERLPESLAEIEALFEALAARKPQRARKCARDHIRHARDAALAVLGAPPPPPHRKGKPP